MQDSLVQQGFDLMAFGMGTVFVFLTLLVICVVAMSAIINRYFVDTRQASIVGDPKPAQEGGSIDPFVLQAIQEAIYQHRART